MNDDRLHDTLGAWLERTEMAPPESTSALTSLMARVARTRQRARRWPWVPISYAPATRSAGRRRPRGSAGSDPSPATLAVTAVGIAVVVVGGVLLMGVMGSGPHDGPAEAPLPPPTTTDAVLMGLETVQVEDGVLRVVSDGVHDVAGQAGSGASVVAGRDGSVWLLTADELFRLGSDTTQDWGEDPTWQHVEVAPDGTVWRTGEAGLYSLTGGDWALERKSDGDAEYLGLEVTADGAVWIAWRQDGCRKCPASRVGRLDKAGWTVRQNRFERHREPVDYRWDDPMGHYLAEAFSVDDNGSVWLGGRWDYFDGEPAEEELLELTHQIPPYPPAGWNPPPPASPFPDDVVLPSRSPGESPAPQWNNPWVGTGSPYFGSFDAAHGGILWQDVQGGLARFTAPRKSEWEYDWDVGDGGYLTDFRWTVFTEPDSGPLSVPDDAPTDYTSQWDPVAVTTIEVREGAITGPVIAAAPDGSAWLDGGRPCSGLAHFDGHSSQRFLADSCIVSIDVAMDGTAWVLAADGGDDGPVGLYVISPAS